MSLSHCAQLITITYPILTLNWDFTCSVHDWKYLGFSLLNCLKTQQDTESRLLFFPLFSSNRNIPPVSTCFRRGNFQSWPVLQNHPKTQASEARGGEKKRAETQARLVRLQEPLHAGQYVSVCILSSESLSLGVSLPRFLQARLSKS